MKFALILYGSVRTFFMPMREYKNKRLCDLFIENILNKNDIDIFISTDDNDYFYNGTQYFSSNKIEILEKSTNRINEKINFISSEESSNILKKELYSLLGTNVKECFIDKAEDTRKDIKYNELKSKTCMGAPVAHLIGQYKKLKTASNLLEKYENQNNKQYDFIIKVRFDAGYLQNSPLIFSNYDYNNIDIYTAGHVPPIVYDWYAFGKSWAMKHYINLYDRLGFTLPENIYMLQCGYDAIVKYYGNIYPELKECSFCGKTDKMLITNITMASEYHLFKTFEKFNIRHKGAGYHTWIYRYNEISKDINELAKELNFNNVDIINDSSQKELEVKKY